MLLTFVCYYNEGAWLQFHGVLSYAYSHIKLPSVPDWTEDIKMVNSCLMSFYTTVLALWHKHNEEQAEPNKLIILSFHKTLWWKHHTVSAQTKKHMSCQWTHHVKVWQCSHARPENGARLDCLHLHTKLSELCSSYDKTQVFSIQPFIYKLVCQPLPM
jgi:hypothetical protein